MVEWTPISEEALRARIAQGESRMAVPDRRLWNAVRIAPEKWRQHPHGDAGGGFWVVGLIGRTVIWYNDLDDGFCRSRFHEHGTIDDYWRNHDELEIAVQFLRSAIDVGADLLELADRVPEQAWRQKR